MRINHNISALKACNILGKTNNALDKSLERLSSGYRINRAADDAAGLAISEKMKTQIAGLEQAARNAADGISVIQTAEGALDEVEAMLQRMRELSVQAANGVNTDEDRAAIQDEINQLNEEINRVSTTTEFNTKKLLNGTVDRRSYSDNEKIQLISLSDSVAITEYKLKVSTAPEAAKVDTTLPGTTSKTAKLGYEGKISVNNKEIEVVATDTLSDVYEKLREAGSAVDVDITPVKDNGAGELEPSTVADAEGLRFESKDKGDDASVQIYCTNEALAKALGISSGMSGGGVDAVVELDYTSGFATTATVSVDGDYVTVTDVDGFRMKFKVEGTADATVTVLKAGPMDLQIGANEGQTMEVRIPKVDTDTLGTAVVNVNTQESAQKAITIFENAINEVSSIRAKLGAYQNRLEHSINSLNVSAENLTEALSRVEDVDMAKEMVSYTQQQVLSQSGNAMLAQANERPQNILSLLQS
ncbi:MAG: flagellin [Lachnospiraceae bacterium]|nr:flagellin [Lachnospiraceae bacterium]